jgi:O-antigen ligase
MTPTPTAIGGAIALNVPTIAAVTLIPLGALLIGGVVLALLGAALGAATGWAIAPAADERTRFEGELPRLEDDLERWAA